MKYTMREFSWAQIFRFFLIVILAVCFVSSSGLQAGKKDTKKKPIISSLNKTAAIDETVVNIGRVHCYITNSTSEKATGDDDQTFIIGHSALSEPSMRWAIPPYDLNDYLYLGLTWVGMKDTDGTWKNVKFRPETSTDWRILRRGVDADAVSDMDVIFSLSDQSDFVSAQFKLNFSATQRVYAWSESYRDQFIIFDYIVRNIGTVDREVYVGFHQDADISGAAGGSGVLGFWRDDQVAYYRDDVNKEYISMMYDGDNPNIPGNDAGGAMTPKESTGYIGSRLLYCPPTTTGLPEGTQSGHTWWDWNSDPADDNERMLLLSDPTWRDDPPSPHDYRFFQKTGPFDCPAGDSVRVVFGYGVGEGLEGLRTNLQWAYDLFQNNYEGPSAPSPPSVTITPGDRQVTLSWGSGSETSIDPLSGQVDFEGYRVYRTTDKVNWALLADYDLINDIGDNTGVEHEFVDTDVLNGFVYYYGVTAYDRFVEGVGSLETGKQADIFTQPGSVSTSSLVTEGAGGIHVVPNPFIKRAPWDFAPTRENPNEERLQFVNLPGVCTVKVFSLAGDLIAELENDDPTKGYIDWDLITRNTQKVVSGIYIYVVESSKGNFIDKFVVVR